ncbi:MAG: 3-phosphoshikimate 1-carboxyvinyltransferase [Candidatus Omnitrophota bacterium]
MKPLVIQRVCRLKGKACLPGDKSIAHRALFISAISRGPTVINNFPDNQDCLATVDALRKLGIEIKPKKSDIVVYGKGLWGLTKPKSPIFINASGTTFRLLLGLLAGQDFKATLSAGKSLSKRPMLRVTVPLRKMGAKIIAKKSIIHHPSSTIHQEEYPPVTISGGNLRGISYKMPVASAQVKSALLLAGLYAKGITKIIEPILTRDHTERMLKAFGAEINSRGGGISVKGNKQLRSPKKIYLSGDISSAGFFMVAAAIVPGSRVVIKKVSLNPSRIGIIRVLKRMGARIKISNYQLPVTSYEPSGDILVKFSKLRGTKVSKAEIPSLIDELPVLMVAASLAKGKSVFESVAELRVKETDRVKSMVENLRNMGADIQVAGFGSVEKVVVRGVSSLSGAKLKSFGDHRTAMSLVVAGLAAQGKSTIDDTSCIAKSFPEFLAILNTLTLT